MLSARLCVGNSVDLIFLFFGCYYFGRGALICASCGCFMVGVCFGWGVCAWDVCGWLLHFVIDTCGVGFVIVLTGLESSCGFDVSVLLSGFVFMCTFVRAILGLLVRLLGVIALIVFPSLVVETFWWVVLMMMCLKFSVLVGPFDFCLWYACEVGFLTFGGVGLRVVLWLMVVVAAMCVAYCAMGWTGVSCGSTGLLVMIVLIGFWVVIV